ncbi:GATA-domain-containing protein [Marasmius fiardii PR-910]|nr:GATA-domain-containing protein [Marasmius fiardii PR-910]
MLSRSLPSVSSITEPGSDTTSTAHHHRSSHRSSPRFSPYPSQPSTDDSDTPQYKRRTGSRGKKGRGPREKPPGVISCANCNATSSPEWRRGPSGNKDLCNACGLRYATSKKKGGSNYDFPTTPAAAVVAAAATRVLVKNIRDQNSHFQENQRKSCSNCMTTTSPEWRKGPTGEKDLCNACGLRFARKGNFISSSTDSTGSPTACCISCRTTSTPEWRRGPSGNKDLCNACGLRYARTGHLSPGTSFSSSSSSSSVASSLAPSDEDPDPESQSDDPDTDSEFESLQYRYGGYSQSQYGPPSRPQIEQTLISLFYHSKTPASIFPTQKLIQEWARALQVNVGWVVSWVRREQEKIWTVAVEGADSLSLQGVAQS